MVDLPPNLRLREVQRFQQWWLWLIVYGLAVLIWWGFVQQIILGWPWGTNPAPDWMMWLTWLLFGIGFPVFFHSLRLVVEVGEAGISVRYLPLSARHFRFSDIERYQARSYKPLQEYGGWGIKGWSLNRIAYNVSGDQGVELTLHDGRQVLLGSQRPQELADAIAAGLAQT
jgi:hypothetical protein